MLGDKSRSDTYPYMEIDAKKVDIGHEASVSKVGEEQLFYLMSRGISEEEATKPATSSRVRSRDWCQRRGRWYPRSGWRAARPELLLFRGDALTAQVASTSGSLQWSPDSRLLAGIEEVSQGSLDLVVIDPETGAGAHAGLSASIWPAGTSNSVMSFAWAPDSSALAFILDVNTVSGSDVDLYRVDPDGGNLRRLTRTSVTEVAPFWSPDSQWVAVPYFHGLDIVSAEAGAALRLGDAQPSTRIAWSPDSASLAYAAPAGADESCGRMTALYVADLETGARRQLTAGAVAASLHEVTWSPNGEYVFFVMDQGALFTGDSTSPSPECVVYPSLTLSVVDSRGGALATEIAGVQVDYVRGDNILGWSR